MRRSQYLRRCISGCRPFCIAATVVIVLAGVTQAARAQTVDWNAGTGNWFDAGNWNPAGPPTSSNRTTIDNGGTVLIQAPGAQSQALLLGSLNPSSGTLLISNGGTLQSLSGAVGSQPNASGTVTVSGAGSTWFLQSINLIGISGIGTLNILDGGTVTNVGISGSEVGRFGPGTVTVDGAGSTWNPGSFLTLGRADDGRLTISNGGRVTVDGGSGTVALAIGSTGSGTLNIGAGGAPGVLNAAAVDGGTGTGGARINFNHADSRYYFTNTGTTDGAPIAITGSVALNHNGPGTTVLPGDNSYTGATTINAGTLVINGMNLSAVTINDGGTLGGIGTINNFVNVMSGGTIAPGNSIGTLTVAGNLSFAPGSVFRVKVDPAGNADRINVTGGGSATINGGTVDVRAANGVHAPATVYTILNAPGGVTGTFNGVTSNLVFLDAALAYDPNNVRLTLTRNNVPLVSVTATSDQAAVARYLDQIASDADVRELVTEIDGLSAEQARAAFKSLDGDSLTAPTTVALAESRRFLGMLMNRGSNPGAGAGFAFTGVRLAAAGSMPSDLSAVYAQAGASQLATRGKPGRGFWMNGGASRGNAGSDGNASGFDWHAGMLAAGVDVENDRGSVLGAAIAYGKSDLDVEGGSKSTIKSPRAAVYGKADVGAWQLRGAAGYANQEFSSRRSIDLAGVASTASGSHRGREWSATGEADFGIALGSGQLRPLAGFRYVNLKERGYTETGSIADLTVSDSSHASEQSLLGARYVRPLDAGAGSLEVRAIWGHEFGDSVPTVTGRLATALSPATFTVAGVPIKRDALVLGAGISSQMTSRFSLYGDLAAELRVGGQTQYGVLAGLRYAW